MDKHVWTGILNLKNMHCSLPGKMGNKHTGEHRTRPLAPGRTCLKEKILVFHGRVQRHKTPPWTHCACFQLKIRTCLFHFNVAHAMGCSSWLFVEHMFSLVQQYFIFLPCVASADLSISAHFCTLNLLISIFLEYPGYILKKNSSPKPAENPNDMSAAKTERSEANKQNEETHFIAYKYK